MNQERSSNAWGRIGVKQLIIITAILAIACGLILLVGYFINIPFEEFSEAEMAEITDEITRVRYFVSDWYAELSSGSNGNCKVYFNELRFENSGYTLSSAGGRLRAVYPRGERFFKLDYIRSAEFFEIDGKVRCRVYYGNTGEYTFTV